MHTMYTLGASSYSSQFLQVERVIAKFDSNGDGRLDLEEFKKMLNRPKR